MSNFVAWTLFFVGIAHLVFGFVRFKKPLVRAASAGFINQFQEIEAYAAFWFLMSGPPLMLSGHLAIHAVAAGDHSSLQLIGIYTFVSAVIGAIAFPKSPFWVPLVLSPFLVAAGYGMLS